MKRQKQRPDLWNSNVEDILRFQRTVLGRVSEYVQGIGEQAGAGMVDPSAYVQTYADLWRGVISDAGDWSAGPTDLRATREWLKLCYKELPLKATTFSVPFTVPSNSFDELSKDVTDLKLTTSGLMRRGGGTVIDGKNLRLVPPKVNRANRRSALKLFDLEGVFDVGDVYGGLVWAQELDRPVVAISIKVT